MKAFSIRSIFVYGNRIETVEVNLLILLYLSKLVVVGSQTTYTILFYLFVC